MRTELIKSDKAISRDVTVITNRLLYVQHNQKHVHVPAGCALEPTFVRPLDNITVPVGREATFTCSINNLLGHKVTAAAAGAGGWRAVS